jgi:tartrate dehydratase alpha subunit/fumarate hydratase class I-like protein
VLGHVAETVLNNGNLMRSAVRSIMQYTGPTHHIVAQYGSRGTEHLEQLLNEGILRLTPALLQRPGNESV